MSCPSSSRPVLRFATPFDHQLVRFGLLGLHANAFLHGVFDEVDRGCLWYDHEVLRQVCQVRRGPGLALEAEWLGEWLAWMRHEGATSLRLHAEPFQGMQQHHLLDLSEPGEPYRPQGVILSAWGQGLFGERCLASWTPVLETSLARETLRDRHLAFRAPVGVPAESCVATWLRTPQPLPGPRREATDLAGCIAQLDRAVVLGRQAGYLVAELPDGLAQRSRFAAAHYPLDEVPETGQPVPAFFNDPLAEAARSLFVDAGLLAGQLAQVPERTPAHPYDDFNRGPIFPDSDPDGRVYQLIESAVRGAALPWLRLCFEPLQGPPRSEPLERLRLRQPWDLGFGDALSSWVGVVRPD